MKIALLIINFTCHDIINKEDCYSYMNVCTYNEHFIGTQDRVNNKLITVEYRAEQCHNWWMEQL